MQNIFEKIKAFLKAEYSLEEGNITFESNLILDLGLDSLEMTEFVMKAEEIFNIEIPDEELENISTLGQFIEIVENRIE